MGSRAPGAQKGKILRRAGVPEALLPRFCSVGIHLGAYRPWPRADDGGRRARGRRLPIPDPDLETEPGAAPPVPGARSGAAAWAAGEILLCHPDRIRAADLHAL